VIRKVLDVPPPAGLEQNVELPICPIIRSAFAGETLDMGLPYSHAATDNDNSPLRQAGYLNGLAPGQRI
jgi:hypothetical protein